MNTDIIQLETGWQTLRSEGIDKLEYFLETGNVLQDSLSCVDGRSRIFGPNDYSKLYTYVSM